jgi:hypothetical protein
MANNFSWKADFVKYLFIIFTDGKFLLNRQTGVKILPYGAWRSLASALAWGARGRRFKSCRPDFSGFARKIEQVNSGTCEQVITTGSPAGNWFKQITDRFTCGLLLNCSTAQKENSNGFYV